MQRTLPQSLYECNEVFDVQPRIRLDERFDLFVQFRNRNTVMHQFRWAFEVALVPLGAFGCASLSQVRVNSLYGGVDLGLTPRDALSHTISLNLHLAFERL